MADDELSIREARARLSPEDRAKYDHDMIAFGNAVLRILEDETVVYVPPAEWPKNW